MAVVINGVTCLELVEGLKEGIREGGPYASKMYLCAWANRYQLANGFLGLVSHSGTSISFVGPLSYVESTNLLAREVEIEGVGQPTQGPKQLQFPYAKVTVHYGVPTWSAIPLPDISLDPAKPYIYATQEVHYGAEMITVPKSSVTLANGHNLKEIPYAFRLPHAKLSINLQRLPFLPWSTTIITAMKNPINNATFLGVDAGYLLFEGADTHGEASTDGTYVQSMTLNFMARFILRHDEVFDGDGSSGPQQVRYNGSAILGRSDLSLLIPSAYL